jgi:hypothetical protein
MRNGGGGKSSPAKQTTTQTINQRMKKMKYPRTMNEAFPRTVEYSAAIEIHEPRMATTDKIIMVLAVCAVVVLVLDLFVWRA